MKNMPLNAVPHFPRWFFCLAFATQRGHVFVMQIRWHEKKVRIARHFLSLNLPQMTNLQKQIRWKIQIKFEKQLPRIRPTTWFSFHVTKMWANNILIAVVRKIYRQNMFCSVQTLKMLSRYWKCFQGTDRFRYFGWWLLRKCMKLWFYGDFKIIGQAQLKH